MSKKPTCFHGITLVVGQISWSMIALMICFPVVSGCFGEKPTGPTKNGSPDTNKTDKSAKPSLNSAGPGTSSTPSTFQFADRTGKSGINFTYRNGFEAGHFSILESLGGGLALTDFDQDGRHDLFVVGGGRFGEGESIHGLASGLFRNQGNWSFQDVSDPAGVTIPRRYSHGASVADVDSDGFPDVLVTGYGGLQLWHNQGDGTFSEVAEPSGLIDPQWSSSAAWGDFNGDGSLDLYVAHYVDWSFKKHPFCEGPGKDLREVCPPRSFEPLQDVLFIANGDGTFRDATDDYGLRPDGKGLGVLTGDFDLDGDLDVYVANDTVDNFVYENTGQGKFNDISLLSGAALSDRGVPDGSMGVDLFDFNLDGLPDIWVSNYERENCALYQNTGRLLFRHVSQSTGVTAVGGMFVGWGTNCFDIEHDGDEDIFVSNGHVIRYPSNSPLKQVPLLFENQNGSRVRSVAAAAGDYMASPHMGRGTATADIDGDGDLDLAISHNEEPIALLENRTPAVGGWLHVNLVGTISPRDAIGTVVRLTTETGTQMRQYKGGGSFGSTSSRRLAFGLGAAKQIKELEIRWPSGIKQTVPVPDINRVIHVIESRVIESRAE